MNITFNCTHCDAASVADDIHAGQCCICFNCRKTTIIPARSSAITPARAFYQAPSPAPAPQSEHPVEDLLVDGICGAARAAWGATKWVAPKVGRVGLKVAGRGAVAASKTKAARYAGQYANDAVKDAKAHPVKLTAMVVARLMGWW